MQDTIRKVLGKILLIDLIRDLDRGGILRIKVELSGLGWGTTTYIDLNEAGREFLESLLREANVTTLSKLQNVPIQAHIEGNLIRHWRVLTEVI